MSDGRAVARGTALLAVARLVDRCSGAILAVAVARSLGVESLGVFAAAMAVYGLLAVAGEAGTTSFLVREIARDPHRTGPYVVHLSLLGATVGILLTGAALLVVPHLGYGAELEQATQIVVLALVATTLNSIQEAAFVAHGRVELETVTTLVASTLNVAVCLLLLHEGASVVALLATFVAIEYAVTAVYFVLIQLYIVRLRLRVDLGLALTLARDSRSFAGSSLVAALFARPEVVILSLLATERQVGIYGAALKVADLALMVPQVLMTNVFPLLSRTATEAAARFAEVQRAVARLLLAYAVPVTVGLLVLAEPIVRLLYGPEFGGAAWPLRILALGLAFGALAELGWRSLAARGAQHVVLRIQLVTVVIRLGAAGVLVTVWAANGAAVAAVLAVVVNTVLLFAWGRRRAWAPSLLDADAGRARTAIPPKAAPS